MPTDVGNFDLAEYERRHQKRVAALGQAERRLRLERIATGVLARLMTNETLTAANNATPTVLAGFAYNCAKALTDLLDKD